MRARARPAFRRTVRQFEGHGRVVAQADELLAKLLAEAVDGKVDILLVTAAINTLSVQVSEQIGTANDAMEDWRDLAPDDVAELEERVRQRSEAERDDR
jgi:hypothetical protein